jgi:hypothetical protein
VLAAALSQPTGLVHLSISDSKFEFRPLQLSAAVLQKLQQLTYLELARIRLLGTCQDALQLLQVLTRLIDLRLAEVNSVADGDRAALTASMLSGTHNLTQLMLSGCNFEPGVVDGKSQLQHLHLANCSMPGGATSVAQLLSSLQPLFRLQHLQLTHRNLALTTGSGNPPVAAFSALTASSMLQHLDVSWCTLPAGVWQHMFPAGRQLPHLRWLDTSHARQPSGAYASAPDINFVVSCCPGLQFLDMWGLQYSVDPLAPFPGPSALHTLSLAVDEQTAGEGVQAVCQLTGLRELCDVTPPPPGRCAGAVAVAAADTAY